MLRKPGSSDSRVLSTIMTTYKTTSVIAMIREDEKLDESERKMVRSVDVLREMSIEMYDKAITDDRNLTVIVSELIKVREGGSWLSTVRGGGMTGDDLLTTCSDAIDVRKASLEAIVDFDVSYSQVPVWEGGVPDEVTTVDLRASLRTHGIFTSSDTRGYLVSLLMGMSKGMVLTPDAFEEVKSSMAGPTRGQDDPWPHPNPFEDLEDAPPGSEGNAKGTSQAQRGRGKGGKGGREKGGKPRAPLGGTLGAFGASWGRTADGSEGSGGDPEGRTSWEAKRLEVEKRSEEGNVLGDRAREVNDWLERQGIDAEPFQDLVDSWRGGAIGDDELDEVLESVEKQRAMEARKALLGAFGARKDAAAKPSRKSAAAAGRMLDAVEEEEELDEEEGSEDEEDDLEELLRGSGSTRGKGGTAGVKRPQAPGGFGGELGEGAVVYEEEPMLEADDFSDEEEVRMAVHLQSLGDATTLRAMKNPRLMAKEKAREQMREKKRSMEQAYARLYEGWKPQVRKELEAWAEARTEELEANHLGKDAAERLKRLRGKISAKKLKGGELKAARRKVASLEAQVSEHAGVARASRVRVQSQEKLLELRLSVMAEAEESDRPFEWADIWLKEEFKARRIQRSGDRDFRTKATKVEALWKKHLDTSAQEETIKGLKLQNRRLQSQARGGGGRRSRAFWATGRYIY